MLKVFKVYHAIKPTFGFLYHPPWPEGYVLVAEVIARSLDGVFSLTNHIDRPWWNNDGVTLAVSGKKYRSTSVGDVIMDGEEVHRVAGIGFERVEP